jgi:hypothetical protein
MFRFAVPVLLGLVMAMSQPALAEIPDYKPVADWPQLPPKLTLGPVSAVATDSEDRVHIFHRGPKPVLVFDRDGKFLRSWGDEHIKTAMVAHRQGRKHLDRGHRSSSGDEVQRRGQAAVGAWQERSGGRRSRSIRRPTDIAFGKWRFYVSDGYDNPALSSITKALKQWGKKGTGENDSTRRTRSSSMRRAV